MHGGIATDRLYITELMSFSRLHRFPSQGFAGTMALDGPELHRAGLAFVYRIIPVLIATALYGESFLVIPMHFQLTLRRCLLRHSMFRHSWACVGHNVLVGKNRLNFEFI